MDAESEKWKLRFIFVTVCFPQILYFTCFEVGMRFTLGNGYKKFNLPLQSTSRVRVRNI